MVIGVSGVAHFSLEIVKGIINGSFEFRWEKFGITFYGLEAMIIEIALVLLGILLTYMGMRGWKYHRSA